ncbi:transposase [Sinomicrobium oceani]|uniref:transposase n=1 Tax=Sinomicrobium oceani TaxID=1150368 RepID=UPI00227A2829|nr:transposase [Sinomicrobium oceani]
MGKGSYLRSPVTYQELLAEHTAIKEENTSLKAQLAYLYKLISGFKSERFVAEIAQEQLSLFEAEASSPVGSSTETITYTRDKQKHPWCHALPKHLPVREVIIKHHGTKKDRRRGLRNIGIYSGQPGQEKDDPSQICPS